ncbi:MAG: hypothetical protein CL878_00285, partial [Dehalococcoidia bacterium]|nr:hypothetical protein [Dehalococcoidia bacterium]
MTTVGSNRPVRLGFVGTGGRTVAELVELVHIPSARISALCDIDESRCTWAVEQLLERQPDAPGTDVVREQAPQTFTDVRDMLAAVDLDAVYISLPPFAHGDIDHAILDAGKAVFVEKPVAVTGSVGREIAAHIEELGVVSSVGYQSRYSSAVQKARAALEGVPLGLVIAVRIGGLPGGAWWRVQDRSGGMLIEQHTHGVDLMRLFAGEAEHVYASANTVLLRDVPDVDIADVNAATVRFRSGAVGVIANSCALEPGQERPSSMADWTVSLQIVGRGAVAEIGPRRSQVMFAGEVARQYSAEQDPNRLMNEAFVHAVQTGDR